MLVSVLESQAGERLAERRHVVALERAIVSPARTYGHKRLTARADRDTMTGPGEEVPMKQRTTRGPLSRRTFLGNAAAMASVAGVIPRARAGQSAVDARFDLDRFVEDVKRARGEADGQKAVEEVLRRTLSRPGAVIAGLGEPSEAGIHTLYGADDLTILNVVWAPLMVLLPHNHNMWASIGIYTGREDNIIWRRSDGAIEATHAAALSEREVFGLASDAIHSVTNPVERLTGAIHIYGGDFFRPGRSEWDPETLRERPFDLEGARRLFREANERFRAVH
jgi:predicted metal-dependent enzyme (double-stranded beta helix superfamily)